MLSRLLISLLAVGLLSCGFHLRGNAQVPEQALPVYIFKDDTFHDLRRVLTRQLKRGGIRSTDNNADASTVISIISLNKTNSVISVDSLGRTSEVKLGTTVDVAITVDGLLHKKKIHVSKDVAFNPENILSYKKEETILYDEMYSEVSRLILLQLQAISQHAF